MKTPEKQEDRERLRHALYNLSQSHDWQVVTALLIEPSKAAEHAVLKAHEGAVLHRAQGRAQILDELTGHVDEAVKASRK